jgi:hypothetical protein
MGNVANWEVASIDDEGVVTATGFVGPVTGVINATQQVISTDVATLPTTGTVIYTPPPGAVATTLQSGTIGQSIYLVRVGGAAAAVVTPTKFVQGATITFGTAGMYAVLRWIDNTNGWSIESTDATVA